MTDAYPFLTSPRCQARTKTNKGNPCRSPAVRGKIRCRMHGGSKGSGALKGNTNALKHGLTTTASKKVKKTIKETIKKSHSLEKQLLATLAKK